MVKFPTGPAHPHIKASHGADKNINKFYITENSTHFTRGYEKFQPRYVNDSRSLPSPADQIKWSSKYSTMLWNGFVASNYESTLASL